MTRKTSKSRQTGTRARIAAAAARLMAEDGIDIAGVQHHTGEIIDHRRL